MKKVWDRQLGEGKLDSLILTTKPYFRKQKSKNATATALSALNISQAYMLLDNRDSSKYYLTQAMPFIRAAEDSVTKLLFYHIKGTLNLKFDLNYPEALTAFLQGYRVARTSGHEFGSITMLTNIGYIYYMLDDPHGMEYAIEAMNILKGMDKIDPVTESQAHIGLALMQITKGDLTSAARTLDKADTLIQENHLNQVAPLSLAARGDILSRQGIWKNAEEAYRQAIDSAAYSEKSFKIMTYYRYGSSKARHGDYTAADSLLRSGLKLSESSSNLEFRADILLALAKLHLREGRSSVALQYFNRYHNHIDSLHRTRMVQDFNNLVLENFNLEKQSEVQKYKISNLRGQRLLVIFGSLLIILAVIVIALVVVQRKRRRIYEATTRRLMEDIHRWRLEARQNNEDSRQNDHDPSSEALFKEIENLMKSEKKYRDKNLSLESLAEDLGTNRTYVSRAVNSIAGMSFSRYVNRYRISDSLELLSDPDNNIRMKDLAEQVGFTSDSTFSKIFKRETGMSPKEFRDSAITISKGKELD